MTNQELYLAIGVPVLMNGVMATIVLTAVNKRVDDLFNRLASMEARLDLILGKLHEIDTRVSVL